MKIDLYRYQLKFKKPALTSRNVFEYRDVYYVVAEDSGTISVGEMSPLKMLSVDDFEDYQLRVIRCLNQYVHDPGYNFREETELPSFVFGMETLLMWQHGSAGIHFKSGDAIAINGLIWMDSVENMLNEAFAKIEAGFKCIKFKVGAQDFDSECRMLESVRKRYSAFQLEIRLDANGAFENDLAEEQLKELKRFEIHSIEQPIKPGNWDVMGSLVSKRLIDIALDEELIGLSPALEGEKLLKAVKPHYLILKPNLLGGFGRCDHWIKLANKNNAGWWATSALESDIGLYSIANWVSGHKIYLPQGLGTGSLFENNITSPLQIDPPYLKHSPAIWEYDRIYMDGALVKTWVT